MREEEEKEKERERGRRRRRRRLRVEEPVSGFDDGARAKQQRADKSF